jgi:hypothetical protein
MCPSPIRESLRSFVAAVRSSRPGKWGGHRDELPAIRSPRRRGRAAWAGSPRAGASAGGGHRLPALKPLTVGAGIGPSRKP